MDELQNLQELARKAFATTYGFMLMSQNYHWNVIDPNFLQYHELFGRVYKEVNPHIDIFAEQLRGLQTYAPATFGEICEVSSVVEEWGGVKLSPDDMIQNLYLANGNVTTDLVAAYTVADKIKEYGMTSYLSERMDQQRKHGWMLYASSLRVL